MAVAIDTSKDYLLAAMPETVLYFEKEAAGLPLAGVSVDYVEWFPIRKDRLTTDAIMAAFDATARLYKARLGGIEPKTDDLIQRADGSRWIVKLVDVLSFGNEYRLALVRSLKS